MSALEQPTVEPDDDVPTEVPARPALRVVRGEATPEELAALVAVVAARTLTDEEHRLPQQRSAWADRAAAMRQAPPPGPGAWRASAWS